MNPHNPGGYRPPSPLVQQGIINSLLAHFQQSQQRQASEDNAGKLSGLLNALHQKMAQDAFFRGGGQQSYDVGGHQVPVPASLPMVSNPGGPMMQAPHPAQVHLVQQLLGHGGFPGQPFAPAPVQSRPVVGPGSVQGRFYL